MVPRSKQKTMPPWPWLRQAEPSWSWTPDGPHMDLKSWGCEPTLSSKSRHRIVCSNICWDLLHMFINVLVPDDFLTFALKSSNKKGGDPLASLRVPRQPVPALPTVPVKTEGSVRRLVKTEVVDLEDARRWDAEWKRGNVEDQGWLVLPQHATRKCNIL